jgi:hypothetical protein
MKAHPGHGLILRPKSPHCCFPRYQRIAAKASRRRLWCVISPALLVAFGIERLGDLFKKALGALTQRKMI